MLKRKLNKVCFIISCFILMAVTSGSKPIKEHPHHDASPVSKEIRHRFDSSGLCTCIPFIEKIELVKDLRIQLNKNVAGFVKEYIKRDGFFMERTRKRAASYFTMIDSAFSDYGLPVELKYLAYIESGLKVITVSRSGAKGPWAFMPAAAKQYGLRITKYNDERLDYYKSTYAAAALLCDLFDRYQDWLLVIAAYNSGPGWVQKAIKRSGSRNYWDLQYFLPKETRMHVKKFIAVHYYFEGHGSLVTMSKKETENHIKTVNVFISSQREQEKTDTLSTVVAN